MYADDTGIFVSGNNVKILEENVNFKPTNLALTL